MATTVYERENCIGDKGGEGTANGNLGAVYQLLGKYDEAIKYHENVLSIAIEIGDKEGEAITLHNLGFCYHESSKQYENGADTANNQDNLKRSVKYFKDALQCFEWLFDHLESHDKFKISIFDTFIGTYQVLMELLIDLKQSEEALLISEHGRARALADVLDAKYSFNKDVSRSNLETYDDIRSLLSVSKYSLLFLALYNDCVDLWHLTHEKPLDFHRKKISPTTFTIYSEDRKGCHKESLAKMVDAAFNEMQVQ